jgi:predicted deacylase
VTPVANPLAFDARRKHSPLDGLDLDQSFGPRATRLPTERLAERLLEEVLGAADMVVSLHTMAPFLEAVVYAVYKRHSGYSVDERSIVELAALCAPALVCRMRLGSTGQANCQGTSRARSTTG